MKPRPFTIFPINGLYAVETPSRFIPGLRHQSVAAAMSWALKSDATRSDGEHDVEVRL